MRSEPRVLPPWFVDGATALVERLRADGGFTVDPRTGATPTSGFAVNTGVEALVVPATEFFAPDPIAVLAEFVRARPDLLDAGSTTLLGGWYDRPTDLVVLSRVDRVEDREQAVAMGAAHRQTDVYDLGTGQVLPTGFVR